MFAFILFDLISFYPKSPLKCERVIFQNAKIAKRYILSITVYTLFCFCKMLKKSMLPSCELLQV